MQLQLRLCKHWCLPGVPSPSSVTRPSVDCDMETPAISSSQVSSSFRPSPFTPCVASPAPRRCHGPSLQLFSLFTKHTPFSSLLFPAPVRLCLCSSEEKMFPNLRQGGCVRNTEALSVPRRGEDAGWTLLPALMGAWRDLGGLERESPTQREPAL